MGSRKRRASKGAFFMAEILLKKQKKVLKNGRECVFFYLLFFYLYSFYSDTYTLRVEQVPAGRCFQGYMQKNKLSSIILKLFVGY